MKRRLKEIARTLACVLGAASILLAAGPAVEAQAGNVQPGYYGVTIVPTYQNPDTGVIDDVGQNPGIGNMMVQAQVQPVGYVEITEDGTIWLNTRWNQPDANIYAGFETSSDGSQTWKARDFEVTNQVAVGQYEFAGNVFDAVVTDYRIQLDSLSDTIRCTNFVEAMQRECIWFCYISDIYEGVGDEWNTITPPNMSDYTASLSENGYEASSNGTSVAAAPHAKSAAAAPASEAEGTTPELKEREVAEAKTIDEGSTKTDPSEGIVGMEKKDKEKASGNSQASTLLVLLAGIAVGAIVVGAVFCVNKKKKKNQTDLFSDVDENQEEDKPEQ